MTAETIYVKRGRYYIEVGTYAGERDYYPHGAHLIVSVPGGQLIKFNIDPDFAAVEAAIVHCYDAIRDAMHEAGYFKPTRETGRELTATERKAWSAYVAIAGRPQSIRLDGASLHEIIDAGLRVVRERVRDQRASRHFLQ